MSGVVEAVSVVDAYGSSVSLGKVREQILDGLARHVQLQVHTLGPRARRCSWSRISPSRPVFLLYVAHSLGRAAYLAPELLRGQIKVFVVGWELEELSADLLAELRGADAVVAISAFNADTYRRYLPQTPVFTVPLAPRSVDRPASQRGRFGLPEGPVCSLAMFDSVSGLDRKNPQDVITAFKRAFPNREDVRLVVKRHGHIAVPAAGIDRTGERARELDFFEECAVDPRIIVLNEFMVEKDVRTLMASCDVLVSLSRAEGFGLPVLEAMSMGIPVVCTGFSGHLDFATPEGALLVPYDRVPIGDSATEHYRPHHYDRPPSWAQPDLDCAADYLRRLSDDEDFRRSRGLAAASAAAAYRERCTRSTWVTDVLQSLQHPVVTSNHGQRTAEFRQVVAPQIVEWTAHERRVRLARRRLRIRTLLGRVKRALPGVGGGG